MPRKSPWFAYRLLLLSSLCGLSVGPSAETYLEARIIGGSRTSIDLWPWMAALVEAGSYPYYGQFCGGTLVHPQWVLTAAHCVAGVRPESLEALFGQTLLSGGGGERVAIAAVTLHPAYDPDTLEADLALLRLAHPVSRPSLKLAEPHSGLDAPGLTASVVGWGATNSLGGEFADGLRQVQVPLVSNAVCNTPQSYAGDVTANMLCAGYATGGQDACVGDSGGPLLVRGVDGAWAQVGVVSSGEGCALPNYYGVYTRVTSFLDFIDQVVCQDASAPPSPVASQASYPGGVELSWASPEPVDGYQLYYAPYSHPLSALSLDDIRSYDLGRWQSLNLGPSGGAAYYLSLRSYRGVCRSGFSPIQMLVLP